VRYPLVQSIRESTGWVGDQVLANDSRELLHASPEIQDFLLEADALRSVTSRLTMSPGRGHNKATIAVANKLGRIVWAVWQKDVPFAMPEAA
jgi:hypothetical protein